MNNKPRFPNKLLIAGIGLILGGSLFLLWTLGYFPEPGTFLFTVLIIPVIAVGLLMLYLVFIKGKSAQLILPGMILLLLGVFFLLYNTVIPVKSFERIWPVFMDIAGLSLIPYALKRKKKARTGILISSVTLILMSLLFFPFSLKLTDLGFAEFAVRWWPIIIIIIGIIVTLIYFIYKRPNKQLRKPAVNSPGTIIGKKTSQAEIKRTSSKRKPGSGK
ncbi:MAG: hypothetical protein EHM28_01805 [Spirochaetaceae bacterium]|nr:MAG: hypothetical protein EHM28_01805 [Spirochaetaceae bacterium]